MAALARYLGPSPLILSASASFDSHKSTLVYAAQLMMTSGHCSLTKEETACSSEISNAKIIYNLGDTISVNKLKIASCQIKTNTPIT